MPRRTSAAGIGKGTSGFGFWLGEFSMAGIAPASLSMGSTSSRLPANSTINVAWRTSCRRTVKDYHSRSGVKNFFSRNHSIAVDRHRVFHVAGVAAGVGDHHGNCSRLSYAKHQLVPLLQSLNGQRQPAQLVLFIRVSARDVAQQLRLELPQP